MQQKLKLRDMFHLQRNVTYHKVGRLGKNVKDHIFNTVPVFPRTENETVKLLMK